MAIPPFSFLNRKEHEVRKDLRASLRSEFGIALLNYTELGDY
jgi:hypothetical protein